MIINILSSLFVVLLILLCINQINSNRVQGALLEYPFYQKDCINNKYIDSVGNTIGNLIPNIPNRCLNSNGVYSDSNTMYLSSNTNVTSLKNYLGSNGFTLEFWLMFNSTNSIDSTILSIETTNSKDGSLCSEGYQMALEQLADTESDMHGFTIKNCLTVLKKPVSVALPTLSFNKTILTESINHFVITLSYEYLGLIHGISIYYMTANLTVNGGFITSSTLGSTYSFSPTTWTNSAKLYLFSNPKLSDYWPGRIYYFSIYQQILNSNQIIQNYHSKIPYSVPVTTSFSITVNENGEVGNHTNDPYYYSHTIPSNELSVIEFTAYDFDDTAISPNYNSSHEKYYIQIFDQPSYGLLYYYNGTQINQQYNISLMRNISTNSFLIRYRPPYNNYTTNYNYPTTTISFCAISGVTGNVSNNIARASIFVKKVDKPPRIADTSAISALAGVLTTIVLSANVDNPLSSITILKLPINGLLNAIGGSNNLVVGSVIKAKTSTTVQLQYIYTGPQITLNSSNGLTGFDNFQFTFKDSTNRLSIIESKNITVYTALVGNPTILKSTVTNAIENHCSPINVFGKDLSSSHRNLSVIITFIPLYGYIYPNSNCSYDEAYSASDRLPGYLNYQYDKGIAVYYKSFVNGYFSYPTTQFNGSSLDVKSDYFQYKVISSDGASSVDSIQVVKVLNYNHPTNITFTYTSPWENGITVYVQSSITGKNAANYPTLAVISGFNLIDPDRNIGLIRCVISFDIYSFITLNPEYTSKLYFSNSDYCHSNNRWLCQGNALQFTSGGFIGTVTDIQGALNQMSFQSTQRDYTSEVTITLFDGAGGNCMDNAIQGTTSFRDGCYNTSTTIKVKVLGFAGYSSTSKFSSNSSNSLQNIIVVVLYVLGGILAILIIRKFGRCLFDNPIVNTLLCKKSKDKTRSKKNIPTSQENFHKILNNIPVSTLKAIKKKSYELQNKSDRQVVTPDRITDYSEVRTPERVIPASNKKKKKIDRNYDNLSTIDQFNDKPKSRGKSNYNDSFDGRTPPITPIRNSYEYIDDYYTPPNSSTNYDEESIADIPRNSPISPNYSPYSMSSQRNSPNRSKRGLPKRSQRALPSAFPNIDSNQYDNNQYDSPVSFSDIETAPGYSPSSRKWKAYLLKDGRVVYKNMENGSYTYDKPESF